MCQIAQLYSGAEAESDPNVFGKDVFVTDPVDAGLFFKSFFYIAVDYLKNIII